MELHITCSSGKRVADNIITELSVMKIQCQKEVSIVIVGKTE